MNDRTRVLDGTDRNEVGWLRTPYIRSASTVYRGAEGDSAELINLSHNDAPHSSVLEPPVQGSYLSRIRAEQAPLQKLSR